MDGTDVYYGLFINVKKIEFMIIIRETHTVATLQIM